MKKIVLALLIIFPYQSESAETRIRIAVIDSGLKDPNQVYKKYLCRDGNVSFFKDDIWSKDDIGHGTNIISILTNKLNYHVFCINILKVFSKQDDAQYLPNIQEAVATAIRYSTKFKVKYVNMSLVGDNYSKYEVRAIGDSIKNNNTIFYVAAGNEGRDLKIRPAYPACYGFAKSNYRVIGNHMPYSNWGDCVTDRTYGGYLGAPSMRGTSQSTAYALNKELTK